MTLERTIHRRNARKRAKARPKYTGPKFITPDWLVKEQLRELDDVIHMSNIIARQYPRAGSLKR